MQENEYISCIYHTILFFCSKRSYIKLSTLLCIHCIHCIHNKKYLRNITANHSADIDYKDFMNIYKKSISKPYSFLTIDTKLPAYNSVRFQKNLLDFFQK